MKKPKPKTEVFERVVGGDGCEFTVVCEPADPEAASGKDIEIKPGPNLVCKIVETQDRPRS